MERTDKIGFGDLRLIQKPDDFCYGIDAVILAGFASELKRTPGSIVDLGTGTGVIPLILSHKTEAAHITGIEVQEHVCAMAQRNISANGLEGRIRVVCGTVEAPDALGLDKGTIDIVTSNPPYFKRNSGLKNKNDSKMIARHEILGGLEDFMNTAELLLKNKGDFFMIHRPERLTDICQLGRELHLEPKELTFISPEPGKPANIMLVHFVKNGGHGLKLMPTLYVYNSKGKYSDEIRRLYAD